MTYVAKEITTFWNSSS